MNNNYKKDAFTNDSDEEKEDAFTNDEDNNYFGLKHHDIALSLTEFTSDIQYYFKHTDHKCRYGNYIDIYFFKISNIFTGKKDIIKKFNLMVLKRRPGDFHVARNIRQIIEYAESLGVTFGQKLILKLVELFAYPLKLLDPKNITQNICLKAVTEYGLAFKHVPKKYQTTAVCKAFDKYFESERMRNISFNYDEFKKNNFMTYPHHYWDLFTIYTKNLYLSDVPENMRTYKICKRAASKDQFALEYVPPQHRSFHVCALAINYNGDGLEYVPPEFNKILALPALKNTARAYPYIIDKTIEYTRIAIKKEPQMLKDVPDALKTYNICLLAVKLDPEAFNDVPKRHLTADFYLNMVKEHGYAIRFVPKDMTTDEMLELEKNCKKVDPNPPRIDFRDNYDHDLGMWNEQDAHDRRGDSDSDQGWDRNHFGDSDG